MMHAMGVTLGPNSHLYAQKEDTHRISILEQRAHECTRERRMVHRQQQIELSEVAVGMENLLYGPGTDDSM